LTEGAPDSATVAPIEPEEEAIEAVVTDAVADLRQVATDPRAVVEEARGAFSGDAVPAVLLKRRAVKRGVAPTVSYPVGREALPEAARHLSDGATVAGVIAAVLAV
jgi:hypothetical protein